MDLENSVTIKYLVDNLIISLDAQDRLVVRTSNGLAIFGQGEYQVPSEMRESTGLAEKFSFLHSIELGEAGFLRNTWPVVCSGSFQITMCLQHDYHVQDWTLPSGKIQRHEGSRRFASSIIIGSENETMFLVGGELEGFDILDSTMFVTFSKINTNNHSSLHQVAEPGPRLPYPRTWGCFVKLNSSHAILSGGTQIWSECIQSTTSLVYDIDNKVWIQGPDIVIGRRILDCALVQDLDPNTAAPYVIMAGGYKYCWEYNGYLLSTEILTQDGHDMSWVLGPDLPGQFEQTETYAMITTPDQKGALLMGGRKMITRELYVEKKDMAIIRCQRAVCVWTMLAAELKTGRSMFYAVLVPKDIGIICKTTSSLQK